MTVIDETGMNTTFEPPGPGSWMLDTTHHGRRPTTIFMADLAVDGFSAGFARFTKRFGLPLETMRAGIVHGYMYARPIPVGEGKKPAPTPPAAVMWLVSRLHPELRRRAKTARHAWEAELWRSDVDSWFADERDRLIAANLEFQEVDPSALSDDELAGHVEALAAHLGEQFVVSFETHGGDIIPVGDLLATCAGWEIPAADVAPLLSGASPLTTETLDLLAPVAEAMAIAETAPTTLDDVRGLSPEADAAITSWLDLHGWRLLNSDDVDCPTLHERPELQLKVLTNLDPDGPADVDIDPAPLRDRVPDSERAKFDRLLTDARYGLGQRDDSAGIRLNWPAGLARRALQQAGGRLTRAGLVAHADHIICLTPVEVAVLLRGGDSPTAAEVTQRAATREFQLSLDPPLSLGPDEEPPPFAALPKGMGRATAAVMAMIESMEAAPAAASPLTGVGVGSATYTGRACVIKGPDDDFDRIEPGDVLIAPFTSPSFNSVLPLIGAIAVQEGGVLSHTAIVAREFGIPAVVGVAGLLADIRDGETVEVDAAAGAVRRRPR
jgi:rifampicin phosphotransferase